MVQGGILCIAQPLHQVTAAEHRLLYRTVDSTYLICTQCYSLVSFFYARCGIITRHECSAVPQTVLYGPPYRPRPTNRHVGTRLLARRSRDRIPDMAAAFRWRQNAGGPVVHVREPLVVDLFGDIDYGMSRNRSGSGT